MALHLPTCGKTTQEPFTVSVKVREECKEML